MEGCKSKFVQESSLQNGRAVSQTFAADTSPDHYNIPRLRSLSSISSDSVDALEKAEVHMGSYSSGRVRRRDLGRRCLTSVDSSFSSDSYGIKPWRLWDVFRLVNKAKDVNLDDHTISRCRKVLKVIVGLLLTLCVLLLTLVAKTTMLLAASNIYVNITWFCHQPQGEKNFSSCAKTQPEATEGTIHRVPQTVDIRWLWSMYGLIVTPYIFMSARCLWRTCFKKCRNPSWTVFLAVLLTETMHSLGLSIFAFKILPTMDSLRALALTTGAAFVPALLKTFDKVEEKGRTWWTYLADFIALTVQASVLVLWPLHYCFTSLSSSESWAVPVSLGIISVGYWENYINKYSSLGKLGVHLKELKKRTRQMRTKIYIFASLWKIGITLAFMTAIVSGFDFECAKVIYFVANGAECSSLLYPVEVINLTGDEHLHDPYWVMLIQTGACLVCYTLSKTACKILLQVASFSLPLTLSLPIFIATLFRDCQAYKESHGSHDLYLSTYLSWKCEINGDSNHYMTNLVSEFYFPISAVWWLSFVWVTSHVWFPKVEKLAQTERLFVQSLYCGVLLEQSLILNRRRDDRDRESKSEKSMFGAVANICRTEEGNLGSSHTSQRLAA